MALWLQGKGRERELSPGTIGCTTALSVPQKRRCGLCFILSDEAAALYSITMSLIRMLGLYLLQ